MLLPFAAFLLLTATRRSLSRMAVWLAVGCNVLWVLGSAAVLVGGPFAPTWLGYAFVIAQALFVAAITELEIIGLQRVERVTA
jgi:hypothetical protein